ncbi:hypothetical protein NDU88_000652 [Pleurodeles waltl]|uniref:Uncharacterized protein n=1 Tax=Pleurodeles waltl TaxID=8319 RepID=A0AAV7USG9_PLEWA|nr:hypothetical protein NDU88_000652 [Pleurodeles waltl]
MAQPRYQSGASSPAPVRRPLAVIVARATRPVLPYLLNVSPSTACQARGFTRGCGFTVGRRLRLSSAL